MFSTESWQDWTFAGGGGGIIGVPFTPLGTPIHLAQLPAGLTQHYVWIAAGAFRQENANDDWYCQVTIRFSLGGAAVGSLLFSDASAGAAATFTSPKRQVMRVKSDGSGSVQPTLRMQATSNPAWARDNLDIGCWLIPQAFDYLDMVVDDGLISCGAGRIVFIRTGFRILSF